MKLKLTILALVATTGLSAFGQGFLTFGGPNTLYDVFNGQAQGAGNGKRGSNGEFDVAFLWTATTNLTQDPLSSAGGTPSSKNGPANKQTATNGVYSVNETTSIAALLGAGYQFATNGTALVSSTGVGGGTWTYNGGSSFGVANTTAGQTIQVIVVAWNASAGLTAILNGTGITAFGYSNPFDYITGTSSGDAIGNTPFSNPGGLNEFGVAANAVPEPTTLALAGLGAAMLIFRKRKE